MNKTVMLCCPMTGMTVNQVKENIKPYCDQIKERYGEDTEILVNVSDNDDELSKMYKNPHMQFMARGINECMLDADVMAFTPDWKRSRGCRIEHYMAREYHIPIIILDGPNVLKPIIEILKKDFDKAIEEEGFLYNKEDEYKYICTEEYVDEYCEICNTFIDERSGDPVIENIMMFNDTNQYGMEIFPGETDSFGWLTFIIEYNEYRMVFG